MEGRVDSRASSRVQRFGTSVFIEMSRLARDHGAVNLGQGFPDFAGPAFAKEAAVAAIMADHNQYAPSHGTSSLREAIAVDWARRFDREVDPEREVTVTSGATEAIFAAIQALLGPGDEVVAFEPFYDSYQPSAVLAGATIRPITLRPPDWTFDPDELAAAFRATTKVLLLNTPHNPTGKVFSLVEMMEIARLCEEHDVVVVADEVYDRIVYDGHHHIPMATLPGMWERTLTINSTGKTFSMTGWKIGFAVGPAPLSAALRAVHQFVTFASPTPFQEAMATSLQTAATTGYYRQLARDYQRRREALGQALEAAGLPTLPIGGSYFLMADISEAGFADDVAFCRWLTREAGVTAVPPSAFYADPARAPLLARFCFAKQDATIELAADRLAAVRHRLSQPVASWQRP
jgi:aspartate/methionine/tyrosine aminotransferase